MITYVSRVLYYGTDISKDILILYRYRNKVQIKLDMVRPRINTVQLPVLIRGRGFKTKFYDQIFLIIFWVQYRTVSVRIVL